MEQGAGVTNEPLQTSLATYSAITILTALAWYNVVELNFLIFLTFRRYKGLYFWSLLISSWGTALQVLGFILKFFPIGCNVYVSVTIITIGWYCMVTGQSVVLYSRIHLVVHSLKTLRGVLIMIIVDAILFHTPTTVLTFGANSTVPGTAALFTTPYAIMEKIQMTAFCIQETIISAIYVRATLRLFGTTISNSPPKKRSIIQKPMVRLILTNILIIAMDIVLLGIEYASLYDIEVILKSFIYSVKLKLEFAVLTQLKNYVEPGHQSHNRGISSHYSGPHQQSYVSAGGGGGGGGGASGIGNGGVGGVIRSFGSNTASMSHPRPVFPTGIAKSVSLEVTESEKVDGGGTMPDGASNWQAPRSVDVKGINVVGKRPYDNDVRSFISSTSSDIELGPYIRNERDVPS